MIKRWLVALILFPVMLSCSPNADKSFHRLSKLEGNWISAKGTTIFFQWKRFENDIEGMSYSLQNRDSIFFNRFKIEPYHDSLFLYLKSDSRKKERKRYRLTNDWFNKYIFETQQDVYPFRITISLKNDTLWHYRQENIRGNKAIDFELKRITP